MIAGDKINSMNYEHLFSELTPKLLLDHYWRILDLIEWEIDDLQDFTEKEILKILSKKADSIDNPHFQRTCLRAQKNHWRCFIPVVQDWTCR